MNGRKNFRNGLRVGVLTNWLSWMVGFERRVGYRVREDPLAQDHMITCHLGPLIFAVAWPAKETSLRYGGTN